MFPPKPYEPNFANETFLREYLGLFQALNQNMTDAVTNISLDTYGLSNTIFAFNFSPDLSTGPAPAGHVSPLKTGNLRLVMRFSTQLAQNMTVLLYSEYDSIIEIDAFRNCVTNYN